MRVEFFPPNPVTEPRLSHPIHEEGLAMMLGPGSIDWARSVPRWKGRLRGGRLGNVPPL
jgi:hypothetical protein